MKCDSCYPPDLIGVRLHLLGPSHAKSATQFDLTSIESFLRRLSNSAMIYIFTTSGKSTQITSSRPRCSALLSLKRLRPKTSPVYICLTIRPKRRLAGLQDFRT
jgi:hypothetical protein